MNIERYVAKKDGSGTAWWKDGTHTRHSGKNVQIWKPIADNKPRKLNHPR